MNFSSVTLVLLIPALAVPIAGGSARLSLVGAG